MPDDNISSTGDTALHSHAWFISLDFLPAMSCFLQENTLIHPQLPQCKLKYCCALLQLWVFIFKTYNFFTYSTADIETFLIVLELCSVNHFENVITPKFEGKSLNSIWNATHYKKLHSFLKWRSMKREIWRLHKFIQQIFPINWLLREMHLPYT